MINIYFKYIYDAVKFTAYVRTPYTNDQILHEVYYAILATVP